MNHTYKSTTRLAGIFFIIAFIFSSASSARAVTVNLSSGPVNPPEAVGDLSIPFFTTNTATVRWEVSPADSDTDSTYDIRYSTQSLTADNFANAQTAKSSPIAFSDLHHTGVERLYTITGLTPGTTYHFALKSKYPTSDWSSISDMPSMTLPTHEPATSTFPNSNLGYGQSGLSVLDLQTFLTKQGVYSGPITTYFGLLTKKAVILFQQKNKITPPEGYVGQLTRAVIQTILAAKN